MEPIANPPWGPLDRKSVAVSFAAAFLLRALLALRTPVIGADSAALLLFAEDILRGAWAAGLRSDLHPGYPLMVSLAGSLLGSFEAAGYVVSILFSSLSIVPYYALVRDILGPRAALLSSLVMACYPKFVREQGDIMTEGLFHFLILSSFALSWFAAKRGRAAWSLLAGVAGGFAFLTRPEGIFAAVALPGAALLVAGFDAVGRTRPRLRPLLHAVAGLGLFLILVFPLLAWYHHVTGRWTLSPRDSVGMALGLSAAKLGVGLSVLVAIAGAAWGLRRLVDPMGFLFLTLGAAGAAAAPLSALVSGANLSWRHLLLSGALVIPFGAWVLLRLGDAAEQRWPAPWPRRVSHGVIGLMLVVMAVVGTRSRRADEVTIKETALWIKAGSASPPQVYSNTDKLAYYIGRRTLEVPADPQGLEKLDLKPGEYVVVLEDKSARRTPWLMEVLERRFRRAARFPVVEDGRLIRISVFARAS